LGEPILLFVLIHRLLSITVARLRLLLLPPASVLLLVASIGGLHEYFWRQSATPEQMSDDAAGALLGWWPAVFVALLPLVLQAVVVLPLMRRAIHEAATASIAIAFVITVLATLLFRAPEVEPWYATFEVMCMVVGAPVLLQAAITVMLLRARRPVGMTSVEAGQREI